MPKTLKKIKLVNRTTAPIQLQTILDDDDSPTIVLVPSHGNIILAPGNTAEMYLPTDDVPAKKPLADVIQDMYDAAQKSPHEQRRPEMYEQKE